MKSSEKKQTPLVIPVFIPHAGCPHQCVFCNQSAITGRSEKKLTRDEVRSEINQYLSYKQPWHTPVQISFYGGTFLGVDDTCINDLLSWASEYVEAGDVDSIRFSTRPDSVTPEKLELISGYPVSTIELGVQSLDNSVLTRSGRGHSAEDTVSAVSRLKERGYETGLQIMVGLPGDTEQTLMYTADRIISLNPDFVRIYPAVVLRGSPLEVLYHQGDYSPLELESCVTLVKQLFLRFLKAGIAVVRMGLQASETFSPGGEIIAGPYHPSFGHMVYSALFMEMAQRVVDKSEPLGNALTLEVNPRNVSVMRGLKNMNIDVLKGVYGYSSVTVQANADIPEDSIRLLGRTVSLEALEYDVD